ncbi:MAG: hypothetical protein HYT09_02940, partial [Candidatus Levybacteria bacterium]|nr:hypothetical protein [Candidatus Levybacteria bacterium]
MRYFDEKELVYKLDRILKKEFGTNLSFHEFSAGYGIADMVFAPNFSFKKHMLNRIPITDFQSLSILLTLVDGKDYTKSEIYSLFPQLTQKEVGRMLHALAIKNYIEKIDKESYRKCKMIDPLNPIKSIIAIEVKLNDHKKGLTQARRYQYFADESYLAILKEAERNIDYEEFNKYNIGLILFDNCTNSIEVKHPKAVNRHFQNKVRELLQDS